MARPQSGLPPRKYTRRAPAWNPQMTRLVERCAALVRMKKMPFPYSIGKTTLNVSGVVQGVLEAMADQLGNNAPKTYKPYVDTYMQFDFQINVRKGLHLEQSAFEAYHRISRVLQLINLPNADELSHEGYFRLSVVITVALLWFIDFHTTA